MTECRGQQHQMQPVADCLASTLIYYCQVTSQLAEQHHTRLQWQTEEKMGWEMMPAVLQQLSTQYTRCWNSCVVVQPQEQWHEDLADLVWHLLLMSTNTKTLQSCSYTSICNKYNTQPTQVTWRILMYSLCWSAESHSDISTLQMKESQESAVADKPHVPL